VIIFTAEAVHH